MSKVLQYVEIDIDYCSLTYSHSPCIARLIQPLPSTTKLLLHFEGAQNSTIVTDSSPSAHGNANVSGTAQILNGGGNHGGLLYLDGTSGCFINYSNHSDWEFGSGDFTVDWWEYRLTSSDSHPIIVRDNTTIGFKPWLFGWQGSGRVVNYISSNLSSWDIASAVDSGPLVINTWVHRAIVRNGNNFYFFHNGVLQNTVTSSLAIAASTGPLMIGAYVADAVPNIYWYNGFLDELRISKVARWTSNFDPNDGTDFLQSGSSKCFNTINTCQDRQNFTNVPVTLRFAVPTADLPANIDCIPSIKDIGFDPAVISLGENLGQRATLTVSFDDHRHSDTGAGFDKYLADSPPSRSYDPYSHGTFWGKFRARQPFLRGRNLRWITGTVGQALANMEIRHYIIDSFTGPDNNGKFQIIAKDILKLADGDRAMAPVVSNGFLASGITNVATTATLSPSGIGAEYPAAGNVAIGGSEICGFTRSGDTLTLVRGILNTTAQAHSAQDRVQNALFYNAQAPDVIIYDLLVNYAGVPSGFIDTAAWHNEVSTYLNRLYTASLAQPTSVNDLISELIEQAGLSMWWDDRTQKIGLLVLRGLVYNNYLFDENSTIAETLEVTEQPDKRLSQVHTYFGQINSLTSLTDKSNYRSASVITDVTAETNYGSAAIKEIFSRWIPAGGRSIADRLGTIMLSRFTDPPRHIKLSVLRGSTPEIQLARGYQVGSKFLQDATGAAELVNTQVTRLTPSADIIGIEMDEVIFTAPAEDLTHRNIIIDAVATNLNLRSIHDSLFPTPDATITVIFTINSGVTVYSVSSGLVTIDVGSWPSGVTIIVAINGSVLGAGGAGGSYAADDAVDGGTALYTRVPIKLALIGNLWAGGGGGGGTQYDDRAAGHNWPGAGGGGGGTIVGAAGSTYGAYAASPGTSTAGGAGSAWYGGAGGGPGAAGAQGFQGTVGGIFFVGWPGHRGGYAIDGVSLVTSGSWNGVSFTPGALGGSLLGGQVN